MKAMLEEFRKFILRGNVVDLAVAVVIGTAFGAIVDAIVKHLFMPIVGLITGGYDMTGMNITIYKDAKLGVGFVLQSLVTFLIIGICMFLVVKAMNRLIKKEPPPPPEPTPSEKLLAEIRDLLRDRK
jgi:large conductance mechanosensitive channel